MKYTKVIVIFAIILLSCDDKECCEETDSNKQLKSGLSDSTSLFNIVVDSSYTDTIIVITEE